MHIAMINIFISCTRGGSKKMNQKMSINNMTCIENRISEYYEIRKIPKKVWMKLLQDNIKRSRGTIEKNVVKIN